MSSRGMIAARQRDNSYRPDGAIAPHVLRETVEIDSSEPVLEMNGSFWVASQKFQGRYYRMTIEQGQWFCSSQDDRIQARCKAMVEMYRIQAA